MSHSPRTAPSPVHDRPAGHEHPTSGASHRQPGHRRHRARRRLTVGVVSVAAAIGVTGPMTILAGDGTETDGAATDGAATDGTATGRVGIAAAMVQPARAAGARAVDALDAALAVRFSQVTKQRRVILAAPVEQRESDLLPIGTSRVEQIGQPGERHLTFEVTLRNGRPVSEEVVATNEIPAIPTITVVGTSTSAAATKNWEALARCESGGDPTIISRSGRYHGLYQFDRSTWKSVGGSGLASEASSDEQTRRAMTLYEQRGAGPWPTCGRHL